MKYHYVIDRCKNVIYSCDNLSQLDIAKKYCYMMIDKFFIYNNKSYEYEFMMIKLIDKLITLKKSILI